jgi:very-short-patch-repair endonuclease
LGKEVTLGGLSIMSKKLTIKEVKQFVEENSKCKLLSTEYNNNHENLKFICGCGKEFLRSFNNFNQAKQRQCNKCSNVKTIKYTIEGVKNFVRNNSKCELLSAEYIDCKTNLRFRCACGNEFETPFDCFKSANKRQCDDCTNDKVRNERNYSFEEVKNFVEVESKSNCKLLSTKYINNLRKMMFQCECGNKFETIFSNFKNIKQVRCKKCSNAVSVAEFTTSTILKDNDIDFIPQYKFIDCKHKRGLPFDFYLPYCNIAIEIDGLQHYKPVCFGDINYEKALENLSIQQKHDEIKNGYCKQNNIKLIRIPYTEFKNIETILKSILP